MWRLWVRRLWDLEAVESVEAVGSRGCGWSVESVEALGSGGCGVC